MAPIKRERKSESSTILADTTREEATPVQTPDLTAILARMNALESKNIELEKKVKEASGDISEQIKNSRKIYGKNEDGSINEDEPHKYKYSVFMDEGVEKVVVSRVTIGRPVTYRNFTNGKWVIEHQVKIDFHDGTSKTMDLQDYMEMFYNGGEGGDGDYVRYSDIKRLPNGEKEYTFHTDKFGTFTLNQKFIG